MTKRILRTFSEHSPNIPRTFSEHTPNILRTFPEHPLHIPDKYMEDGKKGRVQGKWVASKISAIRGLLGLGGGRTATAQTALNHIYDNELLKVL